MLVPDCTLSSLVKLWGRAPTRAVAGLSSRGLCDHSLSSDTSTRCSYSQHTSQIMQPTPVSRTPAQSVAMLAGTDGLPTWLFIDRFHVSRHSFSLSHCNGSRVDHRYIMALCYGEWLALPIMSPWWRPTFNLKEYSRLCEASLLT